MKKYNIIDAHCHIYPPKIAQKAVAGTDKFYSCKSEFDGTTETMLLEGEKAGISHFVVCSVATTPQQVTSINRFISQEVQNYCCKMTGLGTLHPESEDIKGDIENIISLGLKGVKLHPDIQRFKLDDYRCLKIYELCEGRLPILIHTGDCRFDYSNPNRLVPILETYTNLTIIGAHLGGYSVWEQAAQTLSEFNNFYVDCSSSFSFLPEKRAEEIIRKFGCERVLFGSDYPMWSAKSELEILLSFDFTQEEFECILYKNAKKMFKL